MHHLLAFVAALMLTAVTVSSACTASVPPPSEVEFTLEPASKGRFQARFRTADRGNNHWSDSFPAGDLSGFDQAAFRAAGTRPLRFAIVREAGRVDCAGTGGNSLARGTCRITPDAGFANLLASRGVGRPTAEQAFALISLDVRSSLINTLASAGYETPDLNDLMGLTAVGVTGRYINELARAGYRPESLNKLLEFAALDITPAYIGGFARIGYRDLSANTLVQFKALDITPEFVAGFERLGYRNIPASKLVEMKAVGVTPDYVRDLGTRPSLDKLVSIRAIGFEPRRN